MIVIRVYGLPAPQGSKRHVGHGVMVESSKNVKPWREAVKWAAIEERNELKSRDGYEASVVIGPVDLNVTFTLPKPKSAPKKRRIFPYRKPDIDKLCRSTMDALVSSGIIEDDSRVVWLRAAKVFPNEGQDALDAPGAIIRIRALDPIL